MANLNMNGKWKQDFSQNENFDQHLREQGIGWFSRFWIKMTKKMPVEEFVVTEDQVTFRQYRHDRVTPTELVFPVGQPKDYDLGVASGWEPFQATVTWGDHGELVWRHNAKKRGEFVMTWRVDSSGSLEMITQLPSGKTSRRVLRRVE